MKIGILTFHRAHNYGAMFQAYGLQEYLKDEGHDVSICDYWPNYHGDFYKFGPYLKNAPTLKAKIKKLLIFLYGIKKIYKRYRLYEDFMKEFSLDSKVQFSSIEKQLKLDYDILVYGSDQIWRKEKHLAYKGFNSIYFGDKIDVPKKITYAASMGELDIEPFDEKFIKDSMQNFHSLSIREQDLIDRLMEIHPLNYELVLDPVFLLNKKDWESRLPPRKISEKYIFVYHLSAKQETLDYADYLSKKHGYKVYETRGLVDPLLKGDRYLQTESPLEFLSLIKNAEIVVTASFHGTAFSVIFEKQFYSTSMGKNAGRVKTLLGSIGISERYVESIASIDKCEIINYSCVNVLLGDRIEQSKLFLSNSINQK